MNEPEEFYDGCLEETEAPEVEQVLTEPGDAEDPDPGVVSEVQHRVDTVLPGDGYRVEEEVDFLDESSKA